MVVVELLAPLDGATVAAEVAAIAGKLELQWVGLDPRSPRPPWRSRCSSGGSGEACRHDRGGAGPRRFQ